jgi:hypothetical protein
MVLLMVVGLILYAENQSFATWVSEDVVHGNILTAEVGDCGTVVHDGDHSYYVRVPCWSAAANWTIAARRPYVRGTNLITYCKEAVPGWGESDHPILLNHDGESDVICPIPK